MLISEAYIKSRVPQWILESQTYYLVITDLQGAYAYVNPFFAQSFDFLATDFIGRPIDAAIHPDDIKICTAAAAECLSNIGKSVPLQIRKPDSKGDYFWSHWEFSAFLDEKGELIGVLCMGHDITESARASQQIKQSEGKLRAIMNSTTNSIVLVGRDYKILAFNKKTEKEALIYYNRQIKEGENFWDYVLKGTEEGFVLHFQQAMYGETVVIENQFSFARDKQFWFEVTYFPVYDHDKGLIGVAINTVNINARKVAEERVKFQNEQLKEIAILQSHAVRRPVSSILGLISLIDKENNIDENEEYIALLEKCTQELDVIIHKIVQKANDLENENQ